MDWSIEERVARAEEKRQKGEELSDKDWTLIAYAFPPRCHACGAFHNQGVEDE